jgi:hypothetical protein
MTTRRERLEADRKHREAVQRAATEKAYETLVTAMALTKDVRVWSQVSEILYILNTLYTTGYNNGCADVGNEHRETLREGGANVW